MKEIREEVVDPPMSLADLIRARLRGRKIPTKRLRPLGKWFPRAMRAERWGMIELQKERGAK